MSKNELINWPIGYKEITRFYKQTETYLNLDSFNRLNSQKIFLKKYKKKNWDIRFWQFVKQNFFKKKQMS